MASPAAPNLLKPQLYLEALRELSPVQPGKHPTAGLVIPDYAVRMAVIDLEEFPSGENERLSLLRFRLRKTVPFHIDEAQLSYSVQVNEPKRIEVLAAEEGYSVEFFDMTDGTVALVTLLGSSLRAPTGADRPSARTMMHASER